MKHDYTNETIQGAIDAALDENEDLPSRLETEASSLYWQREAPARLTLARELLDRLPDTTVVTKTLVSRYKAALQGIRHELQRIGGSQHTALSITTQALNHEMADLPEPTPPVVDGKTPGQVYCAAAVNGRIQFRDWDALSPDEKESCERGASAVLAAFGNPQLSTLRPIAEAGDVPDGCVRVSGWLEDDGWYVSPGDCDEDTHFADIRLPESPKLANAKAHAEFQAELEAVWNAKTWTPKVGDTVKLKSGGPVMTVDAIVDDTVNCEWHTTDGMPQCRHYYPACLKPATKEERV